MSDATAAEPIDVLVKSFVAIKEAEIKMLREALGALLVLAEPFANRMTQMERHAFKDAQCAFATTAPR